MCMYSASITNILPGFILWWPFVSGQVSLFIQVKVLFTATSATGFVTHYYLEFTFPSSISDLSHSVGQRNIVLTLNKSNSALWESFTVRSAEDDSVQVGDIPILVIYCSQFFIPGLWLFPQLTLIHVEMADSHFRFKCIDSLGYCRSRITVIHCK